MAVNRGTMAVANPSAFSLKNAAHKMTRQATKAVAVATRSLSLITRAVVRDWYASNSRGLLLHTPPEHQKERW